MSNTAGDPPYQYQRNDSYYCPHCNVWHNQPCNNYWSAGVTLTNITNHDDEIIDLLKKILAKLEEIRMEIT